MFKAGHATTSAGLWFCDVHRDGRVFCSVQNVSTEDEALTRAVQIAEALNLAASQGVLGPKAAAR